VVLADGRRVRRVLVDERVAAVAEVGARPGAVGALALGAVVLRAADEVVRVKRVQGERLELRRVEADGVEARPA
jgi:hypothetical protein